MAGHESSILLHNARAGSKEALGVILDRYGEKLLTLIRARLGARLRREVEPHDVLQETLLEAFRCIDQFEGSGSKHFMGWLAGIATNKIRYQARYFRQMARDVNLRESWASKLDPADRQLRTEVSRIHLKRQTRQLEKALDSLKEDHREAILLREYEELSFREIGERLGRSEDAARMLLARAMAALSLRMEREASQAQRIG